MAVATIQFGQCGNQVGYELFSSLWRDIHTGKHGTSRQENENYIQASMDQWFEQDTEKKKVTARCVLVDTENKVVNEIMKKQSSLAEWEYNAKYISLRSGGAGNNWALGYQRKGPELHEYVTEAVRIQAEKADRLVALLSMMSSAGGTGSGVGSFIIESLRDEYPTKSFVSTVVLPFEDGEVVTQSYNTLLTLAKVNSVCDATLLLYNDHLHKMVSVLLNLKAISIADLNYIIAQKMVAAYQPHQQALLSPRYKFSDFVSYIAPHPAHKLFSLKSSPHTPKENKKFEGRLQWHVLAKHMKEMLRTSATNTDVATLDWEFKPPSSVAPSSHSSKLYSPSVANILITRGSGLRLPDTVINSDFQDNMLYPPWVPSTAAFVHCHNTRRFNDQDKFSVLATNNSQVSNSLNVTVQKAWKMFTHKAYLHQYTKFGLLEEDFIDGFVKMESIIKSYQELKA